LFHKLNGKFFPASRSSLSFSLPLCFPFLKKPLGTPPPRAESSIYIGLLTTNILHSIVSKAIFLLNFAGNFAVFCVLTQNKLKNERKASIFKYKHCILRGERGLTNRAYGIFL